VVRLGLGVDRDSLVGHIGDITVVVVGGVLNVLGPAIGKSNRVATSDGAVGISGLGSIELGLGVVISNTILIGIGSGHLLLSGVVGGGGSMVSRGSYGVGDNGGSVVHNRGGVDNGSMVDKGSSVDDGSMVDKRSSMVHQRGSMVDQRSSMVHQRGSMVDKRSSMVDRGIRSRVGEGSGSVHGSDRLLMISISMDRLRSSMGLAGDASVDSTMGLVDGNGDGGSISNLDDLVVGLVGGSHSQESGADEGLHVALGIFRFQNIHFFI